MQTRTTIRLPQTLDNRLEELVEQGIYADKSEAIRSYIREGIKSEPVDLVV